MDNSWQQDEPRKERTILEEDCFRERLRDVRLADRALDEILEELGPALCRKPEIYPQTPGTGIHRALILPGLTHPALRIWFEFDEDTVTLIDIEKTEGGR